MSNLLDLVFSYAPTPAAARQLLRAAYLGTLLAAVSLGRTRVTLTLIGGGFPISKKQTGH